MSGKFLGSKNGYKFSIDKGVRSCVIYGRTDYFAIFILISYVLGFLGAGFILHGMFYALALMNRP